MNMSSWTRGATRVVLLSAAFGAASSGIAYAGTTTGAGSVAGGNQASLPVSAPVDVCGLAVAVLGGAEAGCGGGAAAVGGSAGSSTAGGRTPGSTSGAGSVGGGNQVSIPVSAPVNVCGISVAVLGTASASCQGGATVGGPGSKPPPPSTPTPSTLPLSTPPPGSGGGHRHHHHGGKPFKPHHKTPGGHGAGGHSAGGHTTGGHSTGTTNSTAITTVANTGGISSGLLPTTGADLEGLLGLAVGGVISGAALLAASRRRATARTHR